MPVAPDVDFMANLMAIVRTRKQGNNNNNNNNNNIMRTITAPSSRTNMSVSLTPDRRAHR
ncbi:hypothetical protein LZ31DRAFT_556575 [Colletotrichum somersetense]|nr:hypothetical protein LZ31DRAFT_556575 [Colletotrichum somersetense]